MLNSVVQHISKWSRVNHLTLNVEDTNVVTCTPIKLVQFSLILVYFDHTLTDLDILKFLICLLIVTLHGNST
jgi:hypothetical protein